MNILAFWANAMLCNIGLKIALGGETRRFQWRASDLFMMFNARAGGGQSLFFPLYGRCDRVGEEKKEAAHCLCKIRPVFFFFFSFISQHAGHSNGTPQKVITLHASLIITAGRMDGPLMQRGLR